MQNENPRHAGSGRERFVPLRTMGLWLVCAALTAWLPACSLFVTAPPEVSYSKTASRELYRLEPWALEGRLALTGEQDSWTADLDWAHRSNEEHIKLSGPLGQGAVVIRLAGHVVTVAQSDGKVESSDDPEDFINRKLGMFVPVTSLRYWVLGLPEPGLDFDDVKDGFRQSGWTVAFQAMQPVGQWLVPRKMSVANDRVKLKLIIDQWIFHEGNAR